MHVAGGDNLNLYPGFLENGLFDVRHFSFPGSISTPAEMGVARWYPTVVTLPDGTSLIAGGSTAEGGGYGSEQAGMDTDSALNEDTYQVAAVLLLCCAVQWYAEMCCAVLLFRVFVRSFRQCLHVTGPYAEAVHVSESLS